MSVNACDINVSMLLSLLLAKIRILSCSVLFLVIFSNFLTILVVTEKIKVKLALAIPTGARIILWNETVDIPLLVVVKAIKTLSM